MGSEKKKVATFGLIGASDRARVAVTWWFSPVSAQFLGEHLKNERLSRVKEEVITGKHPQQEGNTGLITPGFEIAVAHHMILQATKAGDEAAERRLG